MITGPTTIPVPPLDKVKERIAPFESTVLIVIEPALELGKVDAWKKGTDCPAVNPKPPAILRAVATPPVSAVIEEVRVDCESTKKRLEAGIVTRVAAPVV